MATQVNLLDPTEIPSVGCTSIEKIQLNISNVTSSQLTINNLKNCDVLLFLSFKNSISNNNLLSPQILEFDQSCINNSYQEYANNHSYTPELGKSLFMNVTSSTLFKAFGVVGLGKESNLLPKHGPIIAKEVANFCKTNKCRNITICFSNEMKNENFFQTFLQAFYIQTSPHKLFVSNPNSKNVFQNLSSCTLIMNSAFQSNFEEINNKAKIIAGSTYIAAEMVNAPANYCTTETLAIMAKKIAEDSDLSCKIMDLKEIEEHGMGAFLGVAKGSFFPPKFIHLTYKPKNQVQKKIYLIGKGIVFDSGGYNLKNNLIDIMKMDMGGAAAVFGAAKAIGQLKPLNIEVNFIVAAAENMISGKAYRPGDILKASNGKTIEIGNTDAEGRLTMCDAIVYSEKLGADYIIDIATLTGAAMVALGNKCGALFSTDDELASDIIKSAENTGELIHQLPLIREYEDNFSSKIADMNNISKPPYGGAIIAALFLNKFVEKAKFAHIDMAGPAFDTDLGQGTGYGVKTLTEYILNSS